MRTGKLLDGALAKSTLTSTLDAYHIKFLNLIVSCDVVSVFLLWVYICVKHWSH